MDGVYALCSRAPIVVLLTIVLALDSTPAYKNHALLRLSSFVAPEVPARYRIPSSSLDPLLCSPLLVLRALILWSTFDARF